MSSSSANVQLFESQPEIVLNCGNIASWSKIKKKALLTSTAEVVSAVENTLISYTGSQHAHIFTDDKLPMVRSAGLTQTISPEERENLMVTLKIFPYEWDPLIIEKAIEISIQELGIGAFDTVIVSFPPCPSNELTLDNIKILWESVQVMAKKKKMSVIGVADLDKSVLQQLFDWATVKPRINQVNLAHCCTIPEDLAQYCKDVGITLYTHNDERCLLPVRDLQSTISSTLKVDSGSWSPGWVSRYHSIINLRGIVSHRGYIVKLNNK